MRRLPLRAVLAVLVAALVAGAATAGDVYLGITMSSLSASMSRALQLDDDEGVLVDEVVDDSPAAAAGLAAGDVIVAIGSDRIDGIKGLSRTIRKYEPGQAVKLEILRGGKKQQIDVTLANVPSDTSRSGATGRIPARSGRGETRTAARRSSSRGWAWRTSNAASSRGAGEPGRG